MNQNIIIMKKLMTIMLALAMTAGAKVLMLPQAFIPLCTIVIGHPAEQPQPKDKWMPENVSYNEFGGKSE